MSIRLHRSALYPAALALALAAAPAAAQDRGVIGEKGTLDQVMAEVDKALPSIIGEDSSQLAKKLLNPPLAEPLSKTFSLLAAQRAVFSFSQPVFSPDCARTTTPTGEPDQGECHATLGSPGGEGAFRQLSFSKNLGVGNIRFLLRPGLVDPAKLQPINVDDATAQKVAMNFLFKFFGLPPAEFPMPPDNAPNPFAFVTSLTLGAADEKGEPPQLMTIQKLVMIPRGLRLDLADAGGAIVQPYVPAPGLAKVIIGMNGAVVGAMVEDWRELRPDPALNPADAKSRQQLVQEIAEDLFNDGGGRIARLSAHIVYGVDWRGTYGLLLPAVQLHVTPVSGDLDEQQFGQILEQKIGTAGTVRQYALIGAPQRLPGTR